MTQNETPRGWLVGWLVGLWWPSALSRVCQMNYGAMAMRYDEGVHVQPATCCFLRFDSFLCAAGQKLYADCSLPISGTKTKRNYDHAGSISISPPLRKRTKDPLKVEWWGCRGAQCKWRLTAAVRDLQNLLCKMQKLHPLGQGICRWKSEGKTAACLRVKSRRKCAFNSYAAWGAGFPRQDTPDPERGKTHLGLLNL